MDSGSAYKREAIQRELEKIRTVGFEARLKPALKGFCFWV